MESEGFRQALSFHIGHIQRKFMVRTVLRIKAENKRHKSRDIEIDFGLSCEVIPCRYAPPGKIVEHRCELGISDKVHI